MSVHSVRREIEKVIKNRNFLLTTLFFIIIFWILILNAPHERYPDEFDNILGGKYLLSGKLIYSDWFSHHGPLSYYVSALVNIFSGNSFVHFRYVYGIFLFILTVGSYIFIRRRMKGVDTSFYLLFIFLLSIASTYFWGHMLLADSLSAYLLLPVFGLIVLKAINNKKFEMVDYIFISAFSFLALMSALTYTFLVAGIYLFVFVYYFFQEREDFRLLDLLKILLIIIIPYFLFLLYLVLTRSLGDYLTDAIRFNRDYYIYYPGWEGKPPSNPIRYAILIAQGFHNNFSTLLLSTKDFNFTYPFNITLALANTCFGVYLLFKRKYLAFIFVLGSLIYANARTSPLDSKETDYQSAVYIMFSLFNLSYVLPQLYKDLNTNLEFGKKLIFSFLFILLLTYTFFNTTFLIRKFSYKSYNRYMGLSAGIFDGPRVAPYINRLVDSNGYSWIGPFAFEDLYYLNTKIPSRYQVYLPGMGHSMKIQNQLISDFETNKPDVIYFDKDYFVLGANPKGYGQVFLDFLNENYVLLDEYSNNSYFYSNAVDKTLLMDQNLYINKEKASQVIARMEKEGMIK